MTTFNPHFRLWLWACSQFALALCCAIVISGCDELRRNGKPGDKGYIAPRYVQVKVIEFEPELIQEVGNRIAHRQSYSVVEDEDGKRYRITGKVGPVGDTFKMDVSLMNEIGG
jgi:hypothetical protein